MDKNCTLLIHSELSEKLSSSVLRQQLQKGKEEEKCAALKKIILLMLRGEKLPELLIPIIQYVIPSKNHTIKKLLLIYWEIVEKTSPDGKLLQEMILACNGLLQDLNHPNEYIRGSTCRFLCKLREADLLVPLVDSVRQNLDHRHSYVRRNAVLAVYSIYKQFDQLIPDAPTLIYEFLMQEGDPSCQRNAFIMLFNCAQDKAVEYLVSILDQAASFGELLQLIIIEVIRKVCRQHPDERGKYMRCIFTLLSSGSPAVQFEASSTLVSLSSAPTAIKAAASAYTSILCKVSDNNVKMILLDRLNAIKRNFGRILEDMIMDILRALATPNKDIRQKTLDIALDLVTPGNITEVVQLLKKEIQKTESESEDKKQGAEYRDMLIKAIHQCAVKFPAVAQSVVHTLIEFVGDTNTQSAYDVARFVKEVIQTYPELRQDLLHRLTDTMTQIKSSKVHASVLWIVGEYSETAEDIELSSQAIRDSLGDPTFKELEEEEQDTEAIVPKAPEVLADGTYKTASALAMREKTTSGDKALDTSLRGLIIRGDFFLCTAVCSTFVKLALKAEKKLGLEHANTLNALVLLYLNSFLRLGKSNVPPQPMDEDSYERILQCIRILETRDENAVGVCLQDSRKSFQRLLAHQIEKRDAIKREQNKENEVVMQADDIIKVAQLRPRRSYGKSEEAQDEDELDIRSATGAGTGHVDFQTQLKNIHQLTGFSDAIYAEAFVNVNQYDIVLDVTLTNQTDDTLQHLVLELATLGDLKLCERPQAYTLGPFGKLSIKSNIKVSSTETGVIFGSIVYDVAGSSQDLGRNCVVLNEIQIDIIEMILPATTSESNFRTMWAEFEWENKVAVNTDFTNLKEFLDHVTAATNMKCLTSDASLQDECGFLAANMYARTVFGEDALANISIEKHANKIIGFIRIRSKTQGIALSLGEKITQNQKMPAV